MTFIIKIFRWGEVPIERKTLLDNVIIVPCLAENPSTVRFERLRNWQSSQHIDQEAHSSLPNS